MSKLNYEISFVYFIDLTEDYENSIVEKDELLDALDNVSEVTSYDVENDGEDWCIECIAEVQSGAKRNIDDALDRKLHELLKKVPYTAMDYHYMKGLDNDFYWCP